LAEALEEGVDCVHGQGGQGRVVRVAPFHRKRIPDPNGIFEQPPFALTLLSSMGYSRIEYRLLAKVWYNLHEVNPMAIADTVIIARVDVDDTWRELTGWFTTSMPSLINCEKYTKFVWIGVKSQDAPIYYTLRAGDQNGWQQTLTGMLEGGANNWFRLEINLPGIWAWYRLEIRATVPQQLRCKIVGVRR